MAQQFWHFFDQTGVEHTFGIYHSEDSGHFVAYLDDRVMIIDFSILEDKIFHFYFDRELLTFEIKKIEAGFIYTLKVDKDAETELNIELKKERKEEIHIIILTLIILLAIFLTLYLRMKN